MKKYADDAGVKITYLNLDHKLIIVAVGISIITLRNTGNKGHISTVLVFSAFRIPVYRSAHLTKIIFCEIKGIITVTREPNTVCLD